MSQIISKLDWPAEVTEIQKKINELVEKVNKLDHEIDVIVENVFDATTDEEKEDLDS